MVRQGLALVAAGACSALLVLAGAALPQQPTREDYNSGAFLYRAYCASCHGESGRGDGPVADIGPRPPDLTRLAQKAGGTFPRDDVRAVLSETRRVPGHAVPAMPNWLEIIRRTERDERVVRSSIEALVAHLESLQVR